MPLESAGFIHQLNPANPASSDRLQQGDDHIRLIKAAIKATFPNLTGAVKATEKFLNEDLPARLVPTGTIALFFGADAPAGWAICNGQTVAKADGSGNITTPDLRGRVAIGVSDTIALGAVVGQASKTITTEVAGGHTPTVSIAAAGSHSHTGAASVASSKTGAAVSTTTRKVDDGGSASNIVNGLTFTDPGHSHAATVSIDSAGDHSHVATAEAVPGHSHAATLDVTQPSLALHYILKV
jgi:microcystin-dependent protein